MTVYTNVPNFEKYETHGLNLEHMGVPHDRSERAPKLTITQELETPLGKDLWTNEPLPPPKYPPPPSRQ
ncbi:hypothetical protein GOBAR_AA26517 [Gossypium barbadense]|uniref:Uncharacterized protein n=1 Tax=Gossypium barbadense TaxID=3634 RepID=A0A2P5WST0_GOSBA|nr:hypothetical protein GOBAR_AA26517 [Gossypium barbadense]